MSLIKEALWYCYFDTPMPEGMTYWRFAHLREIKWIDQDIEDQLNLVKKLEKSKNPDLVKKYIETEKQNLRDLYDRKIKLETEPMYEGQ